MKVETKEVYKCDHCNKLYQRKWLCEKHELSCKKRPDYLRPCHSCKILKKQRETIWAGYDDMYGNEAERVVEVLFCEKRDCFIYPPSVAAKGNAFDMGDNRNEEMPKQCEFYVEQDFL
jgi:hypothetical protein